MPLLSISYIVFFFLKPVLLMVSAALKIYMHVSVNTLLSSNELKCTPVLLIKNERCLLILLDVAVAKL